MTIEALLSELVVQAKRIADNLEVNSKLLSDQADKVPATDNAAQDQTDKPRRGRPAQAKTEPEKSVDKAPEAKSEGLADTGKPTINYSQVQEALLELAAAKGRSAAIAVLEKFGVKSGKELQPDQYAVVLTAIKGE